MSATDTITADPVKPEEDQEEGTSTQTTKDKEPDETIAEKTEEQTAPKRVIDEPQTSQPQGSMPTSMDAAMKETIEEHSKETEESNSSLMDAKDRTQVTATGTLSLTLIVLLKDILVNGDAIQFYYVSLSLVSVSIALQVIIGVLSMVMYSMKASTVSRGAASKVTTTSRSRVRYSETIFRTMSETEADVTPGTDNPAFEDTEQPKPKNTQYSTGDLFTDFRELDSTAKPWYMRWFPCLEVHEKDLIQKYSIDEAHKRLYDILSIERLRAGFESIEARIRAAGQSEEQQQAATEKEKTLEVVAAQHKVLGTLIDLEQKRDLIKRITLVQQIISYLYYAVFILNAFLIGFGVTSAIQTESGPSDSTAN